jgi:hypothetical protein
LTLTPPQSVQNGGFETGDFAGWTLAGSSGGAANFAGNAMSLAITNSSGRHRPTITYYGPYYIYTGNFAMLLGENGGLAYLSQTLTTVPDAAYLLSFWLVNPGEIAAAQKQSITPNQFEVAWNGSTLFDQANMPVFSYANLQYVVWATNASTTLEFAAQNNNDYFGLDDVSVTPIPPAVFQSALSAGGSITLIWSAVPGATYQLQYATDLSLLNWTNLGSPITAVGASIATSDVQPADPQRFYRVVLAAP